MFAVGLGSLPAGEWIDLFAENSTEGWTPRGEVEKFEIVDGEVHLFSKKNVWVVSDRKMKDFEVSVEVKLPEDAEATKLNTGLGFRLQGETGKPKGYQCEIMEPVPGKNGGVYGIGMGGWLYPGKDEEKKFQEAIDGQIKRGEWNTYRVVCQGSTIQTFVNGNPISSLEDDQSLEGSFGIQHHGKGGTIRFRNLKARALPSPSPEAASKDRPNILWITAEDMSPTLGAYVCDDSPPRSVCPGVSALHQCVFSGSGLFPLAFDLDHRSLGSQPRNPPDALRVSHSCGGERVSLLLARCRIFHDEQCEDRLQHDRCDSADR